MEESRAKMKLDFLEGEVDTAVGVGELTLDRPPPPELSDMDLTIVLTILFLTALRPSGDVRPSA